MFNMGYINYKMHMDTHRFRSLRVDEDILEPLKIQIYKIRND